MRIMTIAAICVGVTTLWTLDTVAWADDGDAERRLEKYDVNKDGSIQRREWPGDRESFRELDRNGDGSINLRELARFEEEEREEEEREDEDEDDDDGEYEDEGFWGELRRFDRNGDGVISRDIHGAKWASASSLSAVFSRSSSSRLNSSG